VDISEEFAHEKLCPVLAMYRAKDFDDALDKAERLVADGGFGHTSSLYIDTVTQKEKLQKFSERMKTCRILVNTPSSREVSVTFTTSSLLRLSPSAAVPGEEIQFPTMWESSIC